MQVAYDDLKEELLQAGAELRIPIPAMIDILEQNSRIRRMPRQMVKAMRYLSELSMVAEVKFPEPELVQNEIVTDDIKNVEIVEQK